MQSFSFMLPYAWCLLLPKAKLTLSQPTHNMLSKFSQDANKILKTYPKPAHYSLGTWFQYAPCLLPTCFLWTQTIIETFFSLFPAYNILLMYVIFNKMVSFQGVSSLYYLFCLLPSCFNLLLNLSQLAPHLLLTWSIHILLKTSSTPAPNLFSIFCEQVPNMHQIWRFLGG